MDKDILIFFSTKMFLKCEVQFRIEKLKKSDDPPDCYTIDFLFKVFKTLLVHESKTALNFVFLDILKSLYYKIIMIQKLMKLIRLDYEPQRAVLHN